MDPEIIKRLDALAEKVGATGEYLWRVLVRGEIVAGIVYIGVAVFLGTVALVVLRRLGKMYDGAGSHDRIDIGMGRFITAVLGLAAFLGFGAVGAVMVFSAEASALRTILGR
jgi:hypothetical protein